MRFTHNALLPTAIIALAAVMCVSAQESRPRFEVASIKVSKSFRPPVIKITGDRLVATGVTLTGLLQYSFHQVDRRLPENEIIGVPAWASNKDRFDVEAKSEGEVIPPEQAQRMMQSLLEDRFQLKAHWDTRELPIYNLVVAKQEKLKLSDDQTPPQEPPELSQRSSAAPVRLVVPSVGVFNVPPLERGQINSVNVIYAMVIRGRAIPIEAVAKSLEEQLGYSIHNKTDLRGLFDIQVQFAKQVLAPAVASSGTPQSATPSVPSLFTALQEQLGLKLESARGPVEVLVIDSVSKPTEN